MTNRNEPSRGNSYNRRSRKLWLLKEYGDGATAPCHHCRIALTFATLTVDRIIPGARGGTYARTNIRPSCSPCATRTGNELRAALRAESEALAS